MTKHEMRRFLGRAATAVLLAASLAALACGGGPVEGGPEKRIYAESAWDAKEGRMLVFEGQFGPTEARVASWAWKPDKRAWTKIAGLEGDLPTCALDWYASAGTMVCFVGTRWTSISNGKGYNVSETWTYDAAADRWNRLETSGTPTPGLLGARVAYSPKADRLILFGGWDFFGKEGWSDETWILDLAAKTWTRATPPESPPSRNYHAMAYDAASDRVIVFGSDHGESGPLDVATWAYDIAADGWTKLSGAPMPEPLVYTDLVYVPELGGCLLFGGVEGEAEKPRGATWLLTADKGWSKLDSAHAPSPRGWHSMAWDPVSKRAWLYGGGSRRNMATQELWYWDLAKRDWFQVERKL